MHNFILVPNNMPKFLKKSKNQISRKSLPRKTKAWTDPI